MEIYILFVICLHGIQVSYLAPILEEEKIDYPSEIEQLGYKKYLKEVISLLITDPKFNELLQSEEKNIAENPESFSSNLAYVSLGIRNKLDELKRKELDSLRKLLRVKDKIMKSDAGASFSPDLTASRMLSHMDQLNPNSFGSEDLEKLIKKTTSDLAEIDRKRSQEYKQYEMMKELDEREKFQQMPEDVKHVEMKKMEDRRKKHRDHPKLHHPGNEEQLKKVWEDDGMDKEQFDPRTFFYLHDTNGDSYWDDNEVEALFQKELDKAYNPEAVEDDMVQRYEEMYRMREHVTKEMDTNQDRVISLNEFLEYASRKDFKKDEEWETIDSKKVYTEEELKTFEEEKKKVINQAKNKVRMNVDPNIVRMQQDSDHRNQDYAHQQQGGNAQQHNVPQQVDNTPHKDIPMQQHIPQQETIPQHRDQHNFARQDNILQHQENDQQQQQQHYVPQQVDNAQHQNIPLQQHIPQQENIPQHEEQNNLPVYAGNQHDAPQQHDVPQQHDDIPHQQHIPEHQANEQEFNQPNSIT